MKVDLRRSFALTLFSISRTALGNCRTSGGLARNDAVLDTRPRRFAVAIQRPEPLTDQFHALAM